MLWRPLKRFLNAISGKIKKERSGSRSDNSSVKQDRNTTTRRDSKTKTKDGPRIRIVHET